MENNIFLYPQPQKIQWEKGKVQCAGFGLNMSQDDGWYARIVDMLPLFENKGMHILAEPVCENSEKTINICPVYDETQPDEGYGLQIEPDEITLRFSDRSGAFYGLMTLYQLWIQAEPAFDGENSNVRILPQGMITDYPSLKIRGFMLDISRGKIPTVETVKHLIDLLAMFKYNHLELYIEGLSFAYPSFSKYWADKTPLTPEEFREIGQYCRQNSIDFVPNQNCLGHMMAWLAIPEFRHLAELEEGFKIGNFRVPPTTVNAANDEVIELIEKLTDDLLPNFTSSYFHVNMDEPFEMGRGKNKEMAEKQGKGAVYLAHLKRIYELVKARNHTMIMWGDEVAKYPEILKDIPEDVIINDWGYEAEHPFEDYAKIIKDSGHRFILSPGTNSWSTFTGLTANMMNCIKRSVHTAVQYEGDGIMLTDWGDNGHLQYLSVSYASIAFAGALSWNCENDETEAGLARALNRLVFEDSSGMLGQAVLDAGKYADKEEFLIACGTLISLLLTMGEINRKNYNETLQRLQLLSEKLQLPSVDKVYRESYEHRKPFDLDRMVTYLDGLRKMLEEAKPACDDGALVIAEYKNAINMVELLTKVRGALAEENRTVGDIVPEMDAVRREHKKLWDARNKESDWKITDQMLEKIGGHEGVN